MARDPILAAFEDALLTRRVAMKFKTKEQLDAYLKAHPKADKSKHSVGGGGEDKGPKKEEKGKGDTEKKPDAPKKQLGETFKPTRYHKDLGGMMSQWHGPGVPAISEVASHLIAEKPVPRKRLQEAASELEKMLPDAKAGKHGWGKSEVKELNKMISHLKNLHDNVE